MSRTVSNFYELEISQEGRGSDIESVRLTTLQFWVSGRVLQLVRFWRWLVTNYDQVEVVVGTSTFLVSSGHFDFVGCGRCVLVWAAERERERERELTNEDWASGSISRTASQSACVERGSQKLIRPFYGQLLTRLDTTPPWEVVSVARGGVVNIDLIHQPWRWRWATFQPDLNWDMSHVHMYRHTHTHTHTQLCMAAYYRN